MSGEVFREGILQMSDSPLPPVEMHLPWIDGGLHSFLVVVSTLLLIVNLRGFLQLFPQLVKCVTMSRGCVNLEHSVNMARLRNISLLVFLFPFCLAFVHYRVLPSLFGWSTLPDWAEIVSMPVFIAAFLFLRLVFSKIFGLRRMDYDNEQAVHNNILSYFLLLCLSVVVTVGVFEAFNVPDIAARTVLLVETALFYLMSLLKTLQIMSSFYNGFVTILYLCALEIVPAAAVVLSCTLLSL